ncbi:MAG: cobalt-precorrin-6A reductase [Litoreibacter sp.]|nr:cobalt-precorrin-6A reductase [Litoreibacter sp.]MCY4336482.1 cobalt-precorrin-6A reductase [Litoreibacter sp.]
MRVLLLAGTGEAMQLAQALVDQGHQVLASLAGATRTPRPLPCETRVGGFGGADGFLQVLSEYEPDLVLDATHPFAHRISNRTIKICGAENVPYLQLLRPKWKADVSRQIFEVGNASAAREMTEEGARVFLATGRQTLQDFTNFQDCTLICRQIDPPDAPFPFPNGKYLIGRPPFSVQDEIALFKEEKIDILIVKNAGGAASYSKIEAAQELGIRTLMLARPEMSEAPRVETVEEALEWVDGHAHH